MLRAVLLGVLSLSAVACKSKTDAAASSQPGAAAGKVVEVKGTVSVKHADATRALASGETVEGDDTVITGADGNVVIELVHNSARWELGPNKSQRVRDSIAWNAKKATAEEVDQATAAAGRPAERNAAGTVATAEQAEAPPPAPPAAQAPAPEPDMQPKGGAPPPERAAPPRRRAASAPKAMAPPPPPAPEATADEEMPAPRTTRGAIRKTESAPAAPQAATAPGGPDLSVASGGGGGAAATPATLVAGKTTALHQCLVDHGAKEDVVLLVDIANGKPTVKLTSKAAISAELDSCVKRVINGITFTGTAKVTRTLKP